MPGFLMLEVVFKQPKSESETKCTPIGGEHEGFITAAEHLMKGRHPLWPADRLQELHQNRTAVPNFLLSALVGCFAEQKVSSTKQYHQQQRTMAWTLLEEHQ